MAKQKKQIKIYGNSLNMGSFCRNLSYILSLKKIRYLDFQKSILLEDPIVLEEPNYKVISKITYFIFNKQLKINSIN